MIKNEIIIINTSMPLRNYMKRRPTHYAEILSKNNRIINVSSTSLKNYYLFKDKRVWEENIFYRLHGTRFSGIRKINKWLYWKFIKRLINKLPQKPILWFFYSGNYDIVKFLPYKVRILEICDDTPEFFLDNPKQYEEVKKNEDKMTEMVDVIFTISDYLKQKKMSIRPDIQVIKNGVVYEDFAETPYLPKNETDELFHYKPPIVGYCGAVSKWFDFDLIEKVASRLKDINFIFIGRITQEQKVITQRLNENSNIYFIGERQYNKLPHYIKYFEITHIPFIINSLILSVSPIKLYEYLAAGKRVVSTPLPEVLIYKKQGIVETASDAQPYAQIIEKMLEEKAEESINSCQDIAKENTWKSRVEMASEVIQKKMNTHL